jgi:pimeloyl-ACP methyl ester carboxylesterase
MLFYFEVKDFPGLSREEFRFKTKKNHILKGYFYSYPDPKPNRLIVFDHGMGVGHRAYMKEIEMLAREGYLVYAYDHTGCTESEGEHIMGLSGSLADLDACIIAMKEKGFSSESISVVGHSWGAFSTMNIAALHPEISHVVAMSGFVSVPVMVSTFFAGPLKGYRQAILDLEMRSNPVYAQFNSVESLKTSGVKALLICSDNDTICKPCHYEILKQGLEDVPTVKFLVAKNKGHNPNYTEDAATYVASFGKARAKFARKKKATDQKKADFVASYDWDRMTEQDESVWQVIFEHLES